MERFAWAARQAYRRAESVYFSFSGTGRDNIIYNRIGNRECATYDQKYFSCGNSVPYLLTDFIIARISDTITPIGSMLIHLSKRYFIPNNSALRIITYSDFMFLKSRWRQLTAGSLVAIRPLANMELCVEHYCTKADGVTEIVGVDRTSLWMFRTII